MDYDLLKRYKDAFIQYEIVNHGVDPRESLEGTTLRIYSDEGYKYSVFDRGHAEIIKGSPYFDKIIAAMSGANLVDYNQVQKIINKVSINGVEEAEIALTMLYESDKDEQAFGSIVKVFGGFFDVLGFCFFIKNCDKYLPVRSRLFDERLIKLGISSGLQGKCNWNKYNEFISYVKEIQEYLIGSLNKETTLLDAHSFLWIIPKLEDYFEYNEEDKKLENLILALNSSGDTDSGQKEYVIKSLLTEDDWIQLLKDNTIFYDKNIELIKRIYLESDHATTCYVLSVQDGVHPTSYISPVVSLAKRIAKRMDIPPVQWDDGSISWWPILFLGRVRKDGLFEWKLQPELANAVAYLFPELDLKQINDEEDEKLILDIKKASLYEVEEGFEYQGTPKTKPEQIVIKGHKTYPRDRKASINALSHAGFKCEFDSKHPTFIRKNSNKPYTETHHLVPMGYSDSFDVSLDVPENIVSLCSNCHNEIHYGKDAKRLVEKLYNERKEVLKSAGIDISLEELLKMYE